MKVMILVVAVAMTVVALWRLPGARRSDPLLRTLWGCSAGFAVALWTRFPPVKEAVNQLGVVDLDALLKYFASIFAALSLANFSVTSYQLSGDGAPRHTAVSRLIARIAQRSTIVVVPTMLALFFLTIDRSHPSRDFAYDHAGDWGAAMFMACFYVYLGVCAWTVAYQWTHIRRHADRRALRIGMSLGAAATWLYTFYAAIRLLYMWVALLAPAPESIAHTVESLCDALNALAAILFVIGASLPTTHVAADRWRNRRCLWQLHPLHKDLVAAFPEVSFQAPRSRLREVTRFSPPSDVLLDNWIQEIGDAVNLLRHHASSTLWPAALDRNALRDTPEAAAEAYWIKTALASAAMSCRSSIPAQALPDKPYATSLGEAYWLLRVQTVYARVSPEHTSGLLAAAGPPCGGGKEGCLAHMQGAARLE
ncbi:MAB_1171c family putative transporter [Streptomyces sp. NPDC056149]|uniref:MAB_1171c family putative transporter n=1 Tax=Streptomyces sp. NPDC056149 TaxID=3345728 RepID=UPI0035D56B09